MKQGYLFDMALGVQKGEEGMNLALLAKGKADWDERRDDWLDRHEKGFQFTADDLAFARLLANDPDDGPNGNNDFSGWFNRARRRHLIKRTGEWIRSRRVSNHGHMIPIWEKVY